MRRSCGTGTTSARCSTAQPGDGCRVGGQVLLAESTADLLSGLDLLDLGPRRLRDVPTPAGVFQVRAPGLRAEFPPLRRVDSDRGNLRPAITSLIGRDTEVSDIHAPCILIGW